MGAGMNEKHERRHIIRGIGELLRSDLYERGKSHPDEDAENSATWWSPGEHLSVTYGYTDDQRVWIRCRDSEGKVYAETDDGDANWLDDEML